MSKQQSDEDIFWGIVDELIELANEKSADVDMGIVNAALMNATARFNAFYVASSSESRNDLKEDKDDSIQRMGAEYKRLYAENLEDYIENYKVYLRSEDEAEK